MLYMPLGNTALDTKWAATEVDCGFGNVEYFLRGK